MPKLTIIAHAGTLSAPPEPCTSGPARETVAEALTAFRDMCVERFGPGWLAIGAWIYDHGDCPGRYQEILDTLPILPDMHILSVWTGGLLCPLYVTTPIP